MALSVVPVLALAAIAAALCLCPIKLAFCAERRGFGTDILIVSTLLGFLSPKLRMRVEYRAGEGAVLVFRGYEKRLGANKKAGAKKRRARLMKRAAFSAAFRRVRVNEVRIHAAFGVETDAALTAFICGAAQVAVSSAFDILRIAAKKTFTRSKKRISVEPRFSENALEAEFAVSLSFVPAVVAAGVARSLIAKAIHLKQKEKNNASHRKHHRNVPRAYKAAY